MAGRLRLADSMNDRASTIVSTTKMEAMYARVSAPRLSVQLSLRPPHTMPYLQFDSYLKAETCHQNVTVMSRRLTRLSIHLRYKRRVNMPLEKKSSFRTRWMSCHGRLRPQADLDHHIYNKHTAFLPLWISRSNFCFILRTVETDIGVCHQNSSINFPQQ